MEITATSVSKAELGQLRPPSQADIDRSIAAASRSPAEQRAHANRMAQLEKAAMQYMAAKQQGQPVASVQKAARAEPVKAPVRHNSVAQAGYGDRPAANSRGRARAPDHVSIQRSIQTHIQRNVQREARKARFREAGQRIKASAAGMVQQVTRAITPPAMQRRLEARSELAATQKMQSMTRHREQAQAKQMDKAKGKETGKGIAPAVPTPARQPQQQKGKEPNNRGRER